MAIRAKHEPGGRGGTLRAYCDECGQPVEDAGLAMYAWDGEAGREHEQGAIPYVLHKRPCSDAFQERSGFGRFSWQELSRFPYFFGEASGVDWERQGELREVYGLGRFLPGGLGG